MISLDQKIEFSLTKTSDLELNTIIEDENMKSETEKSLMTMIKNTFEVNDVLIKFRQAKLHEDRKASHEGLKKKFNLFMKNLIIKNNLLYLKDKFIVSSFNQLRLKLLRRFHDFFPEEHFEYKTMFHAMSLSYFWLEMRNDCRRYAVHCVTCRRSKAYNTQKQKLLASLSISQRKWLNLSLDFVKFLLECTHRRRTYRHILIIVNRLIKRRLYESMMSLFIGELINVMQRRMFFTLNFQHRW
jgi:hypothetical protein